MGASGPPSSIAILVPRHAGQNLFRVTDWPIYVHVAVPNVPDAEERTNFDGREYQLVAWAELYETKEAVGQPG
jgi:hypothetical protein